MTSTTKNEDWLAIAKAKVNDQKQASSSKDDNAIAEAFAQQAYTAIGNRDREIMRDPYLLGFEVVEKNEDNTRLVGSFCFRVGGEILLGTVFYLNGQIKGQNLLYRKGKNRFCPNTDRWVSYLLGQSEDQEGRSIEKNRGSRDSRMNLGLEKLVMPPGYKYASEGVLKIEYDEERWKSASDEERGNRIREIYKEAQFELSEAKVDFMFRDMLVDLDMGKEAAQLAKAHLPFAEMIERGGLLAHSKAAGVVLAEDEELFFRLPADASAIEKKAFEENGFLVVKKAEVLLTLHQAPPDGMSETEVEDLYKRGFSLEDKRLNINLNSAVRKEDPVQTWSSLNTPGLHRAVDLDGQKVKVLWAPYIDGYSTHNSIPCGIGGGRRDDYAMLFLDGKDKGSLMTFGGHVGENSLPIFSDDGADPLDENELPKGSKPKVGAYLIYLPEEKRVFGPLAVASIEKKNGDTIINHDVVDGGHSTMKMVVKKDIEVSTLEDFAPEDYRMPRILGDDAIFIELEGNEVYRHGAPEVKSNICGFDPRMPASFRPLTLATLNRVLSTGKSASVEVRQDGNLQLWDIVRDGKTIHRNLNTMKVAVKLATDLRLSGEDATAFAEEARDHGKVAFDLIPNRSIKKLASSFFDVDAIKDPADQGVFKKEEKDKDKEASAYYDRDLDPNSGDFDEYNMDPDMHYPVVEDYQNQHEAVAIRQRQSRPPGNYMDSWQPTGGRNPHRQENFVPDEVLLNMMNPAEELAQIGDQMGQQNLIDHGAVAAMCKVFDAKPFISNYVGELEKSIDYLARLIFMFYWKPRDFAAMFGNDDLPNMENKLIGVFESYGDMVLDLLQSVGNKMDG